MAGGQWDCLETAAGTEGGWLPTCGRARSADPGGSQVIGMTVVTSPEEPDMRGCVLDQGAGDGCQRPTAAGIW